MKGIQNVVKLPKHLAKNISSIKCSYHFNLYLFFFIWCVKYIFAVKWLKLQGKVENLPVYQFPHSDIKKVLWQHLKFSVMLNIFDRILLIKQLTTIMQLINASSLK